MESSNKVSREQAQEVEGAGLPKEMRASDLELVGHVKVALTARVGSIDLPMRELFA